MYGFNSKVICKNYEQCITNEGVGDSQQGGGGGGVHQNSSVRCGMLHWGIPSEGLMKTFHRFEKA